MNKENKQPGKEGEQAQETINKIADIMVYGKVQSTVNPPGGEEKRFTLKEALEFSEWTAKGLWTVFNGMWYRYRDDDNPLTGEELYEEFLYSKIQQA